MPARFEAIPPQPDNDVLGLSDWIGPENTRSLIRIERGIMLGRLRMQLRGLDPLLRQQSGVCLFKACMSDMIYQVLISDTLSSSNIVFCINRIREPKETKDAPVGMGMVEMTDVTLPSKGKLLAFETNLLNAAEVASRPPEMGTFLVQQGSEVFLHGAMAGSALQPLPAQTPDQVQHNTYVYDALSLAIRVCTPEALVKEVNAVNF